MSETTAPAVTLVEFLEARLDEDERALRWTSAQGRWEVAREYPDHRGRIRHRPTGDVLGEFVHPADAEHAERWQPRRVLTDIQVKRRINALFDGVEQELKNLGGTPGASLAEGRASLADAVLRLLALPYANHPAYNPDWRP